MNVCGLGKFFGMESHFASHTGLEHVTSACVCCDGTVDKCHHGLFFSLEKYNDIEHASLLSICTHFCNAVLFHLLSPSVLTLTIGMTGRIVF